MANDVIRQGGGGPHDSRSVANKIINAKLAAGVPVTHSQVQSLVYLCHAWSLVIWRKPLLRQPVRMIGLGIVCPELYESLRRHGDMAVSRPIDLPSRGVIESEYDARQEDVIRQVIDVYADFSDRRLFNLVNGMREPWGLAYACYLSEGYEALLANSALEIQRAASALPDYAWKLVANSPRFSSIQGLYRGYPEVVEYEFGVNLVVPDRLIEVFYSSMFSHDDELRVRCCKSGMDHIWHAVASKFRSMRKSVSPASLSA